MIAKFRENTIKALSTKLSENDASDIVDVFNAERVLDLSGVGLKSFLF